jgi:hypothetical protein
VNPEKFLYRKASFRALALSTDLFARGERII